MWGESDGKIYFFLVKPGRAIPNITVNRTRNKVKPNLTGILLYFIALDI